MKFSKVVEFYYLFMQRDLQPNFGTSMAAILTMMERKTENRVEDKTEKKKERKERKKNDFFFIFPNYN